MGEYVKATELKIGDWWSSFGRGFIDRQITDIEFGHTVRIINGERVHTPELIIVTSDMRANVSPDSKQYRTAEGVRAVVVPWVEGAQTGYDVFVHGVKYARAVLHHDETAWEYVRRTDGPQRGYVLVTEHMHGILSGTTKSTSLASLVRVIEHQVALFWEKKRQAAEEAQSAG